MEEYVIVNYVWVDEEEIVVGVTDKARWQNDIEEGYSGTDARTMVSVSLKDPGSRWAILETVSFFCWTGDPLRKFAYASIPALFDIAWEIKNNNLEIEEAHLKYFGQKIYCQ